MVRFSAPAEFPASAPPLKRIKRSPVVDDLEENLDPEEYLNGVNATFDMDILECHICLEPLSAPIYQCSNGHLACSVCCQIMSNKCGTCSEQTGKIRCLAMEKLIESLRVNCIYADSGCLKILKYGTKRLHESKCSFAPYACPNPDCDFLAPLKDFSSHFLELHQIRTWELLYGSWNTVLFKPHEKKILVKAENKLFLLYNDKDDLGNLAFLRQFGSQQEEMCFVYHLVVRKGKRRLSLESHPQSILTVERRPCDFLLIPMQTYSIEESLEIELCIRPTESDLNSLAATK
ncbi:hypothetical protein O6H91_03G003200 [Diphasiastrum complanatum]|uniref:Uncharacterized protein n=2 Tax=Diphasiastrum complanatum TaxID=34168 RepID=A0ACC2E2S9_DIPCM|nr:hypothetical protein O6H91_Y547100 [Diphasiastrum complanatum]KAJ7160494.1 hypothetical protein O6H91_Y547100 [Diphasiastrum complanatum]KAJ7160495.1 hypothetical protein O6H91_Y547100 [Diphasiastrum complanatum]KAJ7283032.1 hypothetical protein O6H91_Y352500 [Diphasiastrum complanatum]KAJ7560863.1 hypothetical protein O6H91_03G003200 [Diphasiastrum complanatum]